MVLFLVDSLPQKLICVIYQAWQLLVKDIRVALMVFLLIIDFHVFREEAVTVVSDIASNRENFLYCWLSNFFLLFAFYPHKGRRLYVLLL